MIIYMSAKCSALCYLDLCNEKGGSLGEYTGYVPDFFPGDHFGEYIDLEIDVDSGVILNWKKPTKQDLRETFGVKL